MAAKKPKLTAALHEELFSWWAPLKGFDIAGFDAWLAGMDECGAKLELTDRRRWAKDAIQHGAVNEDALLRHLEWMQLRWKYIRREEYILPLARAGKAVDEARRKPKRPELQKWIDSEVAKSTGETAKELWARAPEWLKDEVGFDRFTKRVTTARKKVAGRK